MARISTSGFAGLLVILGVLLSILPTFVNAEVAYCSSQNTGNGNAAEWDWQSNGWCSDNCKGKSAFAVILNKDCWCSNYAPEDQQDTGDCNSDCPGFPSEKCGNYDKNLYIYLKLSGVSASGTTKGSTKPTSADPSSAPPSSSSTVVTSRDPETVVQTITASQNVVTYTPSSKTSKPTTSQTNTAGDNQAPPETSIKVITQSGAVITETVVTSPTSAPIRQPGQSGSSNTGAIVGGVVGGIAGLAAIIGGIFFLLRRRRQQQSQEEDPQSGVQRNTSTMSKDGLLRTGEKPPYPPPIATNLYARQSRNLDQESISPISGSDRRNSRHMVDQRLNPSTIFVFDNSSRGSVGSVDDSRDYHRPLNVRNPDPEQ